IIASRKRRQGTKAATLRGTETTVVATTIATRCASPVQLLTATTAPVRSRQSPTAALMASIASSPSRTAKTEANESNQLRQNETRPIAVAIGRKIRNTKPGWGSAFDEAKPAMIDAPQNAVIVARTSE